MNKKVKAIILIFALILVLCVRMYESKIDTKYAIEYSRVFGSYDIKEVDQYLNEETLITYHDMTDTYKNLRNNVIAAFDEKKFTMPPGASYGHGDDFFIFGVQTIGIQTNVDSELYSSDYVSMELRRKWLIFYEVESMVSSDDFFGYLFFGIEK